MIRTPKIPFIPSRASWQLALLTTLGIATGTIIPYTWLGKQFDMQHLPHVYYLWLVGTIFMYMLLATLMKKIIVWKYGEMLWAGTDKRISHGGHRFSRRNPCQSSTSML